MRIRYSKSREEYDVETPGETFTWPATRVFNVAELPLEAVLQATEEPGRWHSFKPVQTFTVSLRKGLSDADLASVSSLSAGPFSFRDLTLEKFTRAGGQTFCASTYVSMMEYGWVN